MLIMQLGEADFVSFQHQEHRTMLDVTYCSVFVSLCSSLCFKIKCSCMFVNMFLLIFGRY